MIFDSIYQYTDDYSFQHGKLAKLQYEFLSAMYSQYT